MIARRRKARRMRCTPVRPPTPTLAAEMRPARFARAFQPIARHVSRKAYFVDKDGRRRSNVISCDWQR